MITSVLCPVAGDNENRCKFYVWHDSEATPNSVTPSLILVCITHTRAGERYDNDAKKYVYEEIQRERRTVFL